LDDAPLPDAFAVLGMVLRVEELEVPLPEPVAALGAIWVEMEDCEP
jgi:hypothetical protein